LTYAENYFWEILERTEIGACVALQNIFTDGKNGDIFSGSRSYNLMPCFKICSTLNYFACEGAGPLSNFVRQNYDQIVRFLVLYKYNTKPTYFTTRPRQRLTKNYANNHCVEITIAKLT